jgi:hypothetical protein
MARKMRPTLGCVWDIRRLIYRHGVLQAFFTLKPAATFWQEVTSELIFTQNPEPKTHKRVGEGG